MRYLIAILFLSTTLCAELSPNQEETNSELIAEGGQVITVAPSFPLSIEELLPEEKEILRSGKGRQVPCRESTDSSLDLALKGRDSTPSGEAPLGTPDCAELPVQQFKGKTPIEDQRSQFIYVSTGLNPLPTIAVGYRTLYSSFGSDFAISTSFVPILGGGAPGVGGLFLLPGINYKQLFFLGKGWKGLTSGSSAFYLGAETFGSTTSLNPRDAILNAGGLLGWQFRREKRWDFFEIGIHPLLYAAKKLSITPLASLTYAFLF